MKSLYAFFFVIAALLSAIAYNFSPATPSGAMKDGYYTAEEAEYHYGWKEFLTIYVKDDRIVSAEYDARNSSGFIKSWDMDYMRRMNETDHNYPNKYTRAYVSALLQLQNVGEIDAMSGATESFHSFRMLAEAVVANAKSGNKRVAFVNTQQGKN